MIVSLTLPPHVATALDAASARAGMSPQAHVLAVLRRDLGIRDRQQPPTVAKNDAVPSARQATIAAQAAKLAAHFRTREND